MEPTLPDIFSYSDYRGFLRDHYLARKAQDRKFSHRFIIEKVGASSAGWFADILNGRINITATHLHKLTALLKLKPNQEAYFEALVDYDQARSIVEKNHVYKRILAFKESKADLVGREKFEFYSHWYYSAIRELLFFHDFKGDYVALARKLDPPIRAVQARQAIVLLEKLGFIEKVAGGGWRPAAATLKKDPSVKSLHLANFLRGTMELGIESLDRHEKDRRDLSALTLSFSEEAFVEAREEIKGLRKRLLALLARDAKPTKVYQCSIQFFPLTK